jgi:hypothetical protein
MATITIDLNNVLKLEDVRLQEVNSIETYIEELEWFKELIQRHIGRCKHWKGDVRNRPAYNKLHEFLSQLEE